MVKQTNVWTKDSRPWTGRRRFESYRGYLNHYAATQKIYKQVALDVLVMTEKREFGETFTRGEIELIEKLAELSVTNNALRTEKEVFSRLKL